MSTFNDGDRVNMGGDLGTVTRVRGRHAFVAFDGGITSMVPASMLVLIPSLASGKRPEVKAGPARADDGLPSYVTWNGERYDTPDYEEIEAMVHDSVCDSLTGDIVEPDGWGPDGAPSWLIALGLV